MQAWRRDLKAKNFFFVGITNEILHIGPQAMQRDGLCRTSRLSAQRLGGLGGHRLETLRANSSSRWGRNDSVFTIGRDRNLFDRGDVFRALERARDVASDVDGAQMFCRVSPAFFDNNEASSMFAFFKKITLLWKIRLSCWNSAYPTNVSFFYPASKKKICVW